MGCCRQIVEDDIDVLWNLASDGEHTCTMPSIDHYFAILACKYKYTICTCCHMFRKRCIY